MASDPSAEFDKRWPHNKVSFTTVHFWTINPFPVLDQLSGNKNEEKILLPKFKVDGHDLQFQVTLQFRSKKAENDNEVVFFDLHCYQGKEVASEVPVSFTFTFYDDPTVPETSYGPMVYTFKDDGFPYLTLFSGFHFGNRTILQLITSLTLSGTYIKATSFFLSQMELLNSGTLSDFTVVVGDKEQQQQQIPVHKALLAARSPVFAAMFRHEDTKEAQESQVVISDVRAEVFKDLLQFVYTGVKPKCGRLTTELLTLADKYQVEELKKNCEEYLSASLAVFNVVSYFRIAHLHNAAALKESCLKFMATHFAVSFTSFWFTFKHLSMMANADPRVEFDKRWPHNKVSFTTEHHWTVGQFLILDKSTGEASEEITLSPKFDVDDHDLQFRMALQFWGKKAENDKEGVSFGLRCYQGKDVASEVPVTFTLTFYYESVLLGTSYGPLVYTFKDDGFQYITTFINFHFGNRTTLHQMEKLKVFLKLSGAYIKATSFFLSQMKLLENGSLSDFTVVVGDEKPQQRIPVHRERLAACSLVFAAMFCHEGTKEAQERQVEIPDVRAEVFKDFLQFVYTGVRPKCGRLTTELLILADKYQVEELKENCEEYLSATLSLSTVIPRLKVAALHGAAVLKESCLAFIAKNLVYLVNSSEWEELCKSGNSGDLMVEVTRAIAKYMQAGKK
ncbi:hypothetical protein TYRP_015085 [Tyrophagus putrescentiae]|nr:hypothetical protein TYRP_015085 [Tyrophagus putrescentiae]